MTTENTPLEDAELEAFLGRQSNLCADYDNLEVVEPPAPLDEKILALARFAAKPAAKPMPANPKSANPAPEQPAAAAPAAAVGSAMTPSPAERRKRPRPPKPEADEDEAPSPDRPRWLVPAALAATVAVGVGVAVFMNSSTGPVESPLDGSLFAKRARERGEAGKAAAAASAEQEAEVVVLDSSPLPPPPVFEAEGPQVQDLDAAIAMIRKELVLANQTAAVAEESAAREKQSAPAGSVADTAAAGAPAVSGSVIQPRERRLTKILELYDGGNPELASDSLEIFLRDFEDDPISQRILAVKP